jgi:zinc transport system permease protein
MWNELFAVPFLTGLVLALLLPVLGAYLRLRDEWLAALAYAHVAAAGALLALVSGAAPALGGVLAAGLAGAAKRLVAIRLPGGAGYAVALLGGWALAVLLAANHPLAERLGHTLFDGQLYFADATQLGVITATCAGGLLVLQRLSRQLLLARLYPDFFRLRGLRTWPGEGGFDVLAAVLLALATMGIGVMGAFALVFIPPWIAFRRAGNWRAGIIWSMVIGVAAYVIAFALALALDQPFGPVLALMLAAVALIIA